MSGNQRLTLIEAHPLGIRLERHALTRILGRHRIVVAVQRDPELLGSAQAGKAANVIGLGIERLQQGALQGHRLLALQLQLHLQLHLVQLCKVLDPLLRPSRVSLQPEMWRCPAPTLA